MFEQISLVVIVEQAISLKSYLRIELLMAEQAKWKLYSRTNLF